MTTRTLLEVAAELERQHEKWGEQNHPDGTGPYVRWAQNIIEHLPHHRRSAESSADLAKWECDRLAESGESDWLHILLEEVAEAFAESDPVKLRTELIQVAAVAVQWADAIDRRGD
jgi:hypothetical protein